MADNAATIGALSVILGGDASALDKMLKGAQNSVSGFAKNISQIAGGIGLEKAISGTISALTGMITKGLADADALAKLSEASGVSVDQLSRLKYAADISNVGSDALAKSLQNLSVGLVDLAAGKITPASQALIAMGISAKNADGSVKTAGQTFAEIANKFASYRDGAAKAALAQGVFGAGGEALIPMMNKGSAGLAELGDQAEKFGLVLDDKAQFAVTSLNDNLKRMDAIKQGVALTIVSKMLPAFEQISTVMLGYKENSTLVNTAAEGMTTIFKGVVSIALQSITVISRFAAELGALWGALSSGSWEGFKKGWATYLAEGDKTVEALSGVKTAVADIWASNGNGWDQQIFDVKFMQSEVQKLGLIWTQTKAPIVAAVDETAAALETFLVRTMKSTAGVEAQARTVGMSTDAQARLRVELEAGAIVDARKIKLTEDLKNKITAAADAAAAAAQKLAGNQLTLESLAPWEKRNIELAKYNTLLNAGQVSSDTFAAASRKIQFPNFTAAAHSAMDLQLQLDQLSTNSLNGLASTLASVITGAKSAGEAFAAFGLQVITWFIEMIIKALIFKAIMFAIGFAGGGPVDAAQSLGSTGLSTAGTGGLYDGGGFTGAGGKYEPAGIVHKGEDVWSQEDIAAWGGIGNVEALRLNPGRMPAFDGGGPVASRIPAGTSVPQVTQGSAGAPAVVHLAVKGFAMSRDQLAEMIDGLNGMFRNGYKLKVA